MVGRGHVGFVVARGGARGIVAKGVAGMLVVGFAAVVVDGRGRMGGEACSVEAATAGAAAGRRHGVVGVRVLSLRPRNSRAVGEEGRMGF